MEACGRGSILPAMPRTRKHKPATRRQPIRSAPSRRRVWQLSMVLVVLALSLLAWLDATVRTRFESHQWLLPARVYAQPLELYAGAPLGREDMAALLAMLRYRQSEEGGAGTFRFDDARLHLHTRGFKSTDGGEPERTLILHFAEQHLASLTEPDGAAQPVVRLEPLELGSIHPGHSEDRVFLRLEETPDLLVSLLLAVEDRNYFEHHGISLRGLVRAAWQNLRRADITQGGSTLTQQLVKNFWLNSERTLRRKLLEIPMALLLECHYSKERILETYLNEVYLGQDGARSIHGFGLAARFWFGQPVEELQVHQLALLVGLLKGPSWHDPGRQPERALARRNTVLDVALAEGVISPREHAAARTRPLDVVAGKARLLYAFPHFMDLVRRQLARDYPPEVLASEGLVIHSTLSVPVQLAAERALQTGLDFRDPQGAGALNGAMVVTAANQGDVLAVVGDRQPRRAGFNRALDAQRPVGSLVKPAILLTALEQPGHYTLATLIDDSPFEVSVAGQKTWAPHNFDDHSMGPIPLQQAHALSRNQAMARLGLELGVDSIAATLQRLGVQSAIPHYPSLLLGSLELSPFEVAVMYQTLATGGFRTPLRAITEVLDHEGRPVARYPVSVRQVIESGPAWLLQYAMEKVLAEGTARSARLPDTLRAAGKTGTTDGNRDAWFAGFTGSHLAVVWVGRDDNQPAGVSGATSALPLWQSLMTSIPQRSLSFAMPADVQMLWMAPDGEHQVPAHCAGARQYPLLLHAAPPRQRRCPAEPSSGDKGRGETRAEKRSERGIGAWLRRWFD